MLLAVTSKARRFLSELLEDVIDEAVHDSHSLAGDSDVRMNLLKNLEDVDLVGLNALLASLLLLVGGGSILWDLLLGFGGWCLLCGLLFRWLLLSLGRHG
ncbi:hypothetical protein KIW84_064703 [Lathyrus oleraceus]|uniref:Uncharacterized protein n=2 Tax=Pisum sativum TaxID=3888 RepID=A0A9D4WF20_PEA|nr:hypothetical protein KIW84_064703 [Pisum sativum]